LIQMDRLRYSAKALRYVEPRAANLPACSVFEHGQYYLPSLLRMAKRVRAVSRLTWCLFGLALAGCQALPGDGPQMIGAARKSSEVLPYDVVDLDPTTVASYRVELNKDRVTISGQTPARRNDTVAADDVLKVRIFERYDGGIFPTMQRAGADLGQQRVTESGKITVPFAGPVHVAGLSIPQIQDRIAQQLQAKAPEVQVLVERVSDHTHRVTVSGEVKKPGPFSLLDGLRSVRDAVDAAGGPAATADTPVAQFEITVQRGESTVFQAQYPEFLAGSTPALIEGDEIVVRPNVRRFTALGAVLKAGNVDINKPGMTLLEALGSVGGLSDERANKTGVFVFRPADSTRSADERSRIFRLNLMEPASIFVAQQFEVRPRDVIYVTNAPVYEYNKALSAIYRTVTTYSVLKGVTSTSTSY
jgi:polysaccharide export outer membrane protein